MRILMSGGGTAGHVYPALTVAEQFAAAPDEVAFVGTPDGLEARIVPAAGVAFRPLAASGFDRARPWTLVTSSLRIAASTARAWRWLGADRPDVVIGFGGYVSIPVGLASALRRIPLVLHEQNSVPGIANRVLSRFAAAVAVTYEESAPRFAHPDRVVVTGNPVRRAVLGAETGRRPQIIGTAARRDRSAGVWREQGSASPQCRSDRHARPAARDSRSPDRARGREGGEFQRERGSLPGGWRWRWPLARAGLPR